MLVVCLRSFLLFDKLLSMLFRFWSFWEILELEFGLYFLSDFGLLDELDMGVE